jgi:hypothetical protein
MDINHIVLFETFIKIQGNSCIFLKIIKTKIKYFMIHNFIIFII